MRRVVTLAVLVFLNAAGVQAQTPGHLGLYSDPSSYDCQVLQTYPGIYEIYVIHQLAADVLGVGFSVPIPSCASVSWIGDVSDFPVTVGFSPSGINVGYGTCRMSPIVVMRILYAGAPIQDCCPLTIQAYIHPAQPPYPAAVMCPCTTRYCVAAPVTVSHAYFNANPTCGCTVPAKETTWGRLKATYGE